ncbi:MAG: hypothetical protein ACLUW6_02670 [Coriobacteriaceae bacterium]
MDAEHDEALLRSADADADADTDGGSPSIEAEEQAHLDEVLGAVRAAVDRARGLAERTEASHREAGAQLAASRGELAPEEAHLSAYELNRMDAQAALAHRSRSRLEKLSIRYFARVDFVERGRASSSPGSAEGGRRPPPDHLPGPSPHLGEPGAHLRLAKPSGRAVLRLSGAGRLRGTGRAPGGTLALKQQISIEEAAAPRGELPLQRARRGTRDGSRAHV